MTKPNETNPVEVTNLKQIAHILPEGFCALTDTEGKVVELMAILNAVPHKSGSGNDVHHYSKTKATLNGKTVTIQLSIVEVLPKAKGSTTNTSGDAIDRAMAEAGETPTE